MFLHVLYVTLLAKRALQDTQFNILNDNLVGPTILGFSTSEDDMGAAARLFEDFAKTNKAFELKAAAFDGKVYQGADVSVIANLPNQEKALTMLASVLQAPISKLGRLITALKEKKRVRSCLINFTHHSISIWSYSHGFN